MNKLTKSEKITLLKDYQAGKPVQFPQEEEFTFWDFDGTLYIRVEPKTDQPHKSKMRFIIPEFLEFVKMNQHQYHVVWDSILPHGDMEAEGMIIRIGVEKQYVSWTEKKR